MKPFLVRALALLFVLAILWVEPIQYHPAVFAFGFTHYLLALILGPRPLKDALSHQTGVFTFLGLILFMALAFYLDRKLSFYIAFSAHLALTETYDAFHARLTRRSFYFLRFFFHMACFLTATFRDYPYVENWGTEIILLPLGLLILTYLPPRKNELVHLAGDLLTILVVGMVVVFRPAISYQLPLLLGLYHFSYWLFAPVLYRPGRRNLIITGVNLAVSILLIWPMGKIAYSAPWNFQNLLFAYLISAYAHAALSIAGSRQNPVWVTNIFYRGN